MADVEGMIWENYGTWHIDHFYPCDSFGACKTLKDFPDSHF